MNQTKILVEIQARDTFYGIVTGETTTHYLVAWGDETTRGAHGEEWFAKRSRMVNCSAPEERARSPIARMVQALISN